MNSTGLVGLGGAPKGSLWSNQFIFHGSLDSSHLRRSYVSLSSLVLASDDKTLGIKLGTFGGWCMVHRKYMVSIGHIQIYVNIYIYVFTYVYVCIYIYRYVCVYIYILCVAFISTFIGLVRHWMNTHQTSVFVAKNTHVNHINFAR